MKPIISIIISGVAFAVLITIAISFTDFQTESVPRIETEREEIQRLENEEFQKSQEDGYIQWQKMVQDCRKNYIGRLSEMEQCLDRAEEFKWKLDYLATNSKFKSIEEFYKDQYASELTVEERMVEAIRNNP